MALAIVVTLDKELAAAQAIYAKADNGKAFARELEKIDFAARCKNVQQPSSLVSENPEKLAAQMREEGFDPSKMRLPPERWYPASEGLKVVRALIEYVTDKLNDFKQPNPILKSLRAMEALLVAAEQGGVKFHFSKVEV